MIDTHTHIYSSRFDEDRDEVLERAFQSGVKCMLLPNIDLESVEPMLNLCSEYDRCIPMMGLHPCAVDEKYLETLELIKNKLLQASHQYIAVGEIGIDLYWDKIFLKQQLDAFRIQIKWAKELDLPIVIHARDSYPEIFEVLDERKHPRIKRVFHCFSGSLGDAKHILSMEVLNWELGVQLPIKSQTCQQ